MNNAAFEFDSQPDIQNQIQAIQADITAKFQEIKASIADLQFVNLPAANQMTIAEPASPNTTSNSTTSKSATNSATNSATEKTLNTAKTYAQAAKTTDKNAAQNKQQNWQVVKSKKTAQAAKTVAKTAAESVSYKEKRLILLNSRDNILDSMKARDSINQELKKQLKLTAKIPVLAAITRSQLQQNIVLTTTDNYNADFIIQHEKIWQKFFKYTNTRKDFAWFKVVAHGIPTEIFNFSKGLDLLKQEIKIFNNIHPIAVNWLSNSQNRQEKMHASAVIAFDSEEAAEKALQRLLIAGISVKTAIFEERKASEQCMKCQKFGHATKSCKNFAIC